MGVTDSDSNCTRRFWLPRGGAHRGGRGHWDRLVRSKDYSLGHMPSNAQARTKLHPFGGILFLFPVYSTYLHVLILKTHSPFFLTLEAVKGLGLSPSVVWPLLTVETDLRSWARSH